MSDTDDLAAPSDPPAEASSSVPSADPPAATAGGAASPWNGELDSLTKESWWAEVPEHVQPLLTKGFGTKYSNFHSGADKRVTEARAEAKAASERAAALENSLAETKRSSEYFAKLLEADDAVKPLTEKVASLEQALAAKDTELASALAKAASFEAEAQQSAVQRELARHEAAYPDIFADYADDPAWTAESGKAPEPTGAYVEFVKLVRAGFPEERAAKMVRATMDGGASAPAAPPAPKRPPPAVAAATSPGNAPNPARSTRTTDETYDQVKARKLAEAWRDAENDE